MSLFDRLQRLSAASLDRRQVGVLGAAVLAALVLPDDKSSAKRRKKSKRRQGDRVNQRGEASTGANSHDSHNGPDDQHGSPEAKLCGGLTGQPCPRGYTCVDDPGDTCDPKNGGADCGGICVKDGEPGNPCAAMLCREGTICCPQCGGLCVPRETECSDNLCKQAQCGSAVCPAGHFCCNASCNQCAPLGGACTDRYCPDDPEPEPGVPCGPHTCRNDQICCDPACGICGQNGYCPMIGCAAPAPHQCGRNVCQPGHYCCNPSCGICAPLDGACTQQVCLDPEAVASE